MSRTSVLRGRRGTLLLVLLSALVFRVASIEHSLPYLYVPDTHMIRGALGMAQARDLAPPAGLYTSYPYLMPYLLLPPFAILYAGGRLTGAWGSSTDFAARITDDPTPVYLIARGLVALLGVLGVYLAWRVGRRTVGKGAGLLAALFVASSFLLVHLAQSARPWEAMVTFVLLTAHASLKYARKASARRALWMGLCAGLAIACHQGGGLAVLLPAAAVLARRSGGIGRVVRDGLLAASMFGVTALVVGFPYVLRGSGAAVGVESEQAPEEKLDLGGQSFAFDSFGLARVREVATGFFGADPALVVAAILGLAAGWRRMRRRRVRAVVLVYPTALALLFVFYEGTHVRYLAPLVPFLALFAGAFVAAGWRRPALRPLLLLIVLFPMVQVVRLAWVLHRTDTRTAMLGEIAAIVPANATIAVEAYGPPLRFSPAARDLLLVNGRWTSRREEREATDEAPLEPHRPPYRVVPLERFYAFKSVWPHQWTDPGRRGEAEKPVEAFLDEVGARWLVTTEKFPTAPRNSALDDVLARRGDKVLERLPYRGSPPAHVNLPMDLGFPLTQIWRVERPGPALALWRIRPG